MFYLVDKECLMFLGNGPSGISLSYMLSGNLAYYEGTSSDDLLHARLSQNKDQPLVLQDLQLLSEVRISVVALMVSVVTI